MGLELNLFAFTYDQAHWVPLYEGIHVTSVGKACYSSYQIESGV